MKQVNLNIAVEQKIPVLKAKEDIKTGRETNKDSFKKSLEDKILEKTLDKKEPTANSKQITTEGNKEVVDNKKAPVEEDNITTLDGELLEKIESLSESDLKEILSILNNLILMAKSPMQELTLDNSAVENTDLLNLVKSLDGKGISLEDIFSKMNSGELVSKESKNSIDKLLAALMSTSNDIAKVNTEDITEYFANNITEDKRLVDIMKNLKEQLLKADDTKLNKESPANQLVERNIPELMVNNIAQKSTIEKLPSESSYVVVEDKIATKEDKLLKSIAGTGDDDSSKFHGFSKLFMKLNEEIKETTPTVINKTTMVPDIVKVIKYLDSNDVKELTVKIFPKELGAITIKLTMDGGILKANLTTSNKETYNLLNSNLNDLRNSINDTGIKIQEVNINIYNEDTTFFKDSFNNGQGNHEEGRGSRRSNDAVGLLDTEEENKETIDALNKALNNNISALA